MNYTYLNSFLVAAECLNFTKAANKLHLSQSALSRQIVQLEEELGATLFQRSRHNVKLTAAGSVLMEEARSLISQTDFIANKIRTVAQGENGTIRIVSPTLFSSEIIQIFSDYDTYVPDSSVTIQLATTGQITEMLDRRQADVGLAIGQTLEFERLGYKTMRVCDESICLVVSPSHPFAGRTDVTLSELSDETLLYFGGEDGAMSVVDKAHEKLNAYVAATSVADSLGTLLLNIISGKGIGLMPSILARNKCVNCSFVGIRDLEIDIGVIMLWTPENMNPSLPRFIESVRTTVMRLAKED